MARKLRQQIAGATYHLTTQAVPGELILKDEIPRAKFIAILEDVIKKYDLRVHVYCLMPARYHLLVTTPHPNVSAAMRDLNGRFARWYNQHVGRRGHVFAERFSGDPLETDSGLLDCIRVIALNPTRARLCRSPLDWAPSSYRALVGRTKPPPWLVQDPVLQLFGRTRAEARRRLRAFVEIAAIPRDVPLALAA